MRVVSVRWGGQKTCVRAWSRRKRVCVRTEAQEMLQGKRLQVYERLLVYERLPVKSQGEIGVRYVPGLFPYRILGINVVT